MTRGEPIPIPKESWFRFIDHFWTFLWNWNRNRSPKESDKNRKKNNFPEAGQTVLGQKGTCRNRADGKSPAGFGQMENGSKRLSPFDTTLCRSQSGGQSINFDFPTWLTPAKDGGNWENVPLKWYKVMAAFKLLHLLPLATSTRTPLLHCKYEGHVLPFFKVVMSRILKLSCVILNQL